jgi:menaquinone-9 beta-reductase
MFDAAIIGGGLAGCSAAITLAKRGARVVLFEAKTYPHHKVCGEFLSPECVYLLDELGVLADVYALHPKSIDTVAISSPDGTLWEAKLPGAALGVSRFVLDDCLSKQAVKQGVVLRQGTSVTSVEGSLDETFRLNVRSESGVEQVCAKVVIGAQGKRSNLDRTLNRAFLRQTQPFIALKSHFYGPSLPHRIELHTFTGGYCGMSEIEGQHSNVCLLVREDVFRKVCDNAATPIPAFIQWMQSQNFKLEKWLSHAEQIGEQWLSISQVPFVQKQVVENDILMTGDSAGLIVPLAGDGMAMALQAGKLGATHAAAFLGEQLSGDDLRRGYATAWTNEFGTRLRLGKALQNVMLHPRLLAVGLRLLNTIPPLGTFIIKHTRDTKSLHRSQQRH